MWRLFVTCVIVLTLWACGSAPPTLSLEQAATATAVSAFATFEAQLPEVKQATQTAVMQRIMEGLDATPTP